jgi:hypothetical protein
VRNSLAPRAGVEGAGSSAFSTYWTFSPTVRIRVGLSHSCLDRGRRPVVILRPGQVGSLSLRVVAHARQMTLAKWRNLTTGRVWNRELIENRWIHLSRWVGPGMRREFDSKDRSTRAKQVSPSRITHHSELVAVPLRLAREESTREHRVGSEPIRCPGSSHSLRNRTTSSRSMNMRTRSSSI